MIAEFGMLCYLDQTNINQEKIRRLSTQPSHSQSPTLQMFEIFSTVITIKNDILSTSPGRSTHLPVAYYICYPIVSDAGG